MTPPQPPSLRMGVQSNVDVQEEPSPETRRWMGIGLTVEPGDVLTGALRLGFREALMPGLHPTLVSTGLGTSVCPCSAMQAAGQGGWEPLEGRGREKWAV